MDGLIKSAIVVTALVLLALACGDGDDDAATSTPATSVPLLASATPTESTPTRGETEPPCTPITYEVQPGDVLSAIAVEFGVSVVEIAEASGLEDPDVLTIGQELTIPCPGQAADSTGDEGEGGTEETPTPAS